MDTHWYASNYRRSDGKASVREDWGTDGGRVSYMGREPVDGAWHYRIWPPPEEEHTGVNGPPLPSAAAAMLACDQEIGASAPWATTRFKRVDRRALVRPRYGDETDVRTQIGWCFKLYPPDYAHYEVHGAGTYETPEAAMRGADEALAAGPQFQKVAGA